MNTYPHLTDSRSSLVNEFYSVQTHARRDFLFAKLTGKNASLATFSEPAHPKSPNRRFIETIEIPVDQVVGTMDQRSDFDNKFRPLKGCLRERWVNTYLSLQNGGWAPILVHKIGDQYYVEDGHYRVSVARALGLTFIQAKVWEYPQTAQAKTQQAISCPQRSPANAYAAQWQE